MQQSNWPLVNNKLEKVFTFSSFKQALAFVNQVAVIAQSSQHHPDIQLFDYKFVRLTLSTHSAGKVTEKDHELAQRIDALPTQ